MISIRIIINRFYRFLRPILVRGKNNQLQIKSKHQKSIITIAGDNNIVKISHGCIINNCKICINGDNNQLIIDDTARLLGGCTIILDGNATLHIGKNVGVREVTFLAKDAKIDIGDYCMFSNNIIVRNHDSHKVLNISDNQITNKPKDIALGKHVWIGQNVTILKGVTVGDDSILAVGSVVTKSCPPHCIMAGNPSKIVKTEVSWDY